MKRATIRQVAHAARLTGALLGVSGAKYCPREGRVALPLSPGWCLVLSPDDAERLRVDACQEGRVRATMWVRAGDDGRLAELVRSAEAETAALVAS